MFQEEKTRKILVFSFTLVIVFSVLTVTQSTFTKVFAVEDNDGVKEKIVKVMKRVEDIRGLKFKHDIPVENMTREEFKEYLSREEIATDEDWELAQQEYEALYILKENQNAKNITQSFYSSEVLGFYDHEKDRIVIVGSGLLDEEVLAHELNHALIDQYFPEIFDFPENITDDSFAVSALIEGDVVFTQDEYYRRCLTGVYENCVFSSSYGDSGGALIPEGFVLIHIFPYIEGENFIEYFYRKGGRDSVNRLYEGPPESTEQIIHPEKYGVDKPVEVFVENRCRGGWRILGEDELGEFAIFVMFWNWKVAHFSYKYGRASYSSIWSEGWDGDKIVVYKKTVNEKTKYGYVWRIVWDTVEDVKEFVEAYEDMLKRMGSVKLGDVWMVDEDDYVKIFVDGKTATIVNAPSIRELGEIYPQEFSPLKLNLQLESPLEEPITKLKVGEEGIWVIDIFNNSTQNQPTLCIIQIKDKDGRVTYLSYIEGVIPKNKTYTFGVGWKPRKAGVYTVEVYAWLSWETPQPLSKPIKGTVVVTS
jgi:hypothetical protein